MHRSPRPTGGTDKGHYGDVPLSGLNLIGIGSFQGNLWTGRATGFQMGLFIEARADEQQRGALQMIFSGQAGGIPAQLMVCHTSLRPLH